MVEAENEQKLSVHASAEEIETENKGSNADPSDSAE
jgi:hypothetical protein